MVMYGRRVQGVISPRFSQDHVNHGDRGFITTGETVHHLERQTGGYELVVQIRDAA